MQPTEVGQLQDARGEQAPEGARQGGHDDVQGQAEGELAAAVPAGEVVGDAGHHAGLEDAEQEAHPHGLRLVRDEGGAERGDAEAEGDGGQEPAGADPFADDVGGDLEDDVADVEDGQDGVVVVSFQFEVRFEAC